ncbi:MAG: hypothetical protein L3J82_04925 [Planctomycetes bacterium]|nr:hypothetical protein [Planctomycetota bacterium]
MKTVFLSLALAIGLSACSTSETKFSTDQQAVFDAMKNYVELVQNQDIEALWESLSPDAQELYQRELGSPKGAISTWRSIRIDLDHPESRTSEAQKAKLREALKNLPEDPTKMTPKDYYVWKVSKTLTPELITGTARLWERSNIEGIEVTGTSAIVTLKVGDEKRISWSRHEGGWKLDGKPSTMGELKNARERENGN